MHEVMNMRPNDGQQPQPQQQQPVYQQQGYPQQGHQQPHHVPVQQYQQPMVGNPNQQANVLYVSFNPSPNYRTISYIFLAISVVGSIGVAAISGGTNNSGSDTAVCMIYTACCLPLGIASILDAVFYHTKKSWHENTGTDSTGSVVGMIFDIIFAVICFGLLILIWIANMFG
jgi:hypothetical protein